MTYKTTRPTAPTEFHYHSVNDIPTGWGKGKVTLSDAGSRETSPRLPIPRPV